MLLCWVLLSVCEEATTMALCQDQWKHTQREAKAKIVLFIFVLCTAKSSCIHAISTSSLMAGAKLPPYGQFLLILICGRGRLTGSHMCEQKARIKFAWAEFPTLFRPPPILPLAVFEVSGIFSPKCVIVGMLKLIMYDLYQTARVQSIDSPNIILWMISSPTDEVSQKCDF